MRAMSVPTSETIAHTGVIDTVPSPQTEKSQPIDVTTGCPVDLSNPTTQAITDLINQNGGRITYSDFMKTSLYGPDGYYSKGKVQFNGEREHFLTSPEQSEFFGATIGNGLYRVWEAMGKPQRFDIVEMGAGGGAMASSLLDWMEKVHPDFYDALNYTILEHGRDLIPRQKEKIGNAHKVNWVFGSAFDLPFRDVKGAFISNELPDAFPIERVTLKDGKPKQVYVTQKDGEWVETYDTPQPEAQDYIDRYNIQLDERFEEPINLNAERFQHELDQALRQGVIITIDYGYPHQVGGYTGEKSVWYSGFDQDGKNVRNQKGPVEFRKPGNVDITALVNFKALEQVARKDGLELIISGLQPDLLRRCGMEKFIWKADGVVRAGTYMDKLNFKRELDATEKILKTTDLGEYYAHLLAKGISGDIFAEPPYEPSDLDLPKEKQLAERRIKLEQVFDSLDYSYGEVYAPFPDQKEIFINFENAQGEKKVETIQCYSGMAYLYPPGLKNAIIYDSNGKLLYDFHTDEALEGFLKQAHYAG